MNLACNIAQCKHGTPTRL